MPLLLLMSQFPTVTATTAPTPDLILMLPTLLPLLLLSSLLVLMPLLIVEHEEEAYQHVKDVDTNYGHGETTGRISIRLRLPSNIP